MMDGITDTCPKTCRWVVGCMTGTSVDAIDAALCEMSQVEGQLSAACVARASVSLGSLRADLLAMAEGQPHEPSAFVRAARYLGSLHADLVERLCAESLPRDASLDLLVAHGQTICHLPEAGRARGEPGLSWQLFDPWPAVRRLSVPVLYDLRQADLIAGGQGAPITPIADVTLFGGQCDWVINLGGICNISDLRGSPMGRDVAPCNLLIDQVVQQLFPGMAFDEGGAIAATGRVHCDLFAPLRSLLPGQRLVSLGREDFGAARVRPLVEQARARWSAPDIVASAVSFVATAIGGCVRGGAAKRVVLAGGGVLNQALVSAIRAACPEQCEVLTSDELGIEPQARESVCMAVLGAHCAAGVPITHASTTGASSPGRAGVWAYP